MMRNWFILFTTTFTITTLILTITTWFLPYIPDFNSQYVLLLAISSALISLVLILFNKLSIENIILSASIDISFIFLIVYITGILIQSIPIDLFNFILILSLVIFIYIIITLIYLFILKKEAEDMNKKITHWRREHAESKSLK